MTSYELTDGHIGSLGVISHIFVYNVLWTSYLVQWLFLRGCVDKSRWQLHNGILDTCAWQILDNLLRHIWVDTSVGRGGPIRLAEAGTLLSAATSPTWACLALVLILVAVGHRVIARPTALSLSLRWGASRLALRMDWGCSCSYLAGPRLPRHYVQLFKPAVRCPQTLFHIVVKFLIILVSKGPDSCLFMSWSWVVKFWCRMW